MNARSAAIPGKTTFRGIERTQKWTTATAQKRDQTKLLRLPRRPPNRINSPEKTARAATTPPQEGRRGRLHRYRAKAMNATRGNDSETMKTQPHPVNELLPVVLSDSKSATYPSTPPKWMYT